MGPVGNSWQSTKVGGGPVPIETSEGWLLIYHGVLTSCNGFVYSVGVALLDLEEPWKVIARAKPYLLVAADALRVRRRRAERRLPLRDALRRAHRAPGDLLRRGRHRHRARVRLRRGARRLRPHARPVTPPAPPVRDGDLELISAPIDFLGA